MMVPPRPIRTLAALAALVGLLAAAPPVEGHAGQARPAASGHEPWPGPQGTVDRHVDLRKPPLLRRVAPDVTDRPLAEALELLAREAGFTLAYASGVLPVERRVSTPPGLHVAGDLLGIWLQDTDVVVAGGGKEGQVVLERRLPSPPAPIEPPPSRTGRVAGRVTDAATGAALGGASVILEGTGVSAASRADGRFEIGGAPVGRQTLVARLIGYSEARIEVDIQEGATATVEVALGVSPVRLDQVVVTGTVLPTELRAVPNPVTVITAEDIAARNLFSIDQIFRGMVPGAISADPGLGHYSSTIYVRGSTSLIAGISSVKTYIDGIEVANPVILAGLDPGSIERIEVLRGPQAATIYGPEAINGVVQVFTKRGRPSDSPLLSARTSVGRIGSPWGIGTPLLQDHAIELSGGGGNFSYQLGGSYRAAGEWLPSYGSSTPGVHMGVRAVQGPLEVKFSSRFSEQTFDLAQNPILRDEGIPAHRVPPNDRIALRHHTMGMDMALTSRRVVHRVTMGRDGNEFDSWSRAPRLLTPTDTLLRLNQSAQSRGTFSYSLATSFSPGPASEISLVAGVNHGRQAGMSFLQQGATRTIGSLDGATSSPRRVSSTTTGVFSQLQLQLPAGLSLTAGGRMDRSTNFGDDVGWVLSPRVGGSLHLPRSPGEIKLRASYGQAIRPPAPGAGLPSVSAASRIIGNDDLGPEKQKGWDAGVDVDFGGGLRLAVTRYDQVADGLIENVLVDAASVPPTSQAQNVGRIANRGWEAEVGVDRGAVSLQTTYSTTRSEVLGLSPSYTGALEPGDRMTGVPAHAAGGDLSIRFLRDWRVGAGFTHRGPYTELDALNYFRWAFLGDPFRGSVRAYHMEYPGSTRTDLRLGRSLGDSWDLMVEVRNAGNSLASEVWNTLPVSGRTVVFSARLGPHPLGGGR